MTLLNNAECHFLLVNLTIIGSVEDLVCEVARFPYTKICEN